LKQRQLKIKVEGIEMEEKAQVAFEYLLTALFGIMLAIAAAMLIDTVRGISTVAQAKILQYREETIGALMQG
jgi:hypothetical protein